MRAANRSFPAFSSASHCSCSFLSSASHHSLSFCASASHHFFSSSIFTIAKQISSSMLKGPDCVGSACKVLLELLDMVVVVEKNPKAS
jgi:hypothetical protein